MNLVRRASWTAALIGLLCAATAAFAPPPFRPPPPPPPPVFRPPTFAPRAPGPPMAPTAPTILGGRPSTAIQTTPRALQTQLSGLATKQPATALPKLASAEARQLLPETTRITLGKQAVHQLAVRVEGGRNVGKTLAEVNGIRRAEGQLPREVQARLDRLAKVTERRLLADGLHDVQVSAERGNWAEAGQKADARIAEIRQVEISDIGARNEVVDALKLVQAVSGKLEALAKVEAVLKGVDLAKPGESANRITSLDRGAVPKSIEARLEAWRGLAELKDFSAPQWSRTGDAARLHDAVARVERGLAELPGIDGRLGKMIQQEIAVRSLVEGHAEGYFKLMPEKPIVESAREALRDLKAMALGEGTLSTDAGRSALAEPGSPRPPPGVEPLVPEGAKASWRPPAQESARADLPPLEKAAHAADALKAQAESRVQPERAAAEAKAATARDNLGRVYQRVTAPDQAERLRFGQVEAGINRRLAAEERVRVREWFGDNRTLALIVGDLKKQAAEDEEEAFLARVAARLKRALTQAEKDQAKRLRRAGRTSAEAADILRS